jgi:hypothetical protein
MTSKGEMQGRNSAQNGKKLWKPNKATQNALGAVMGILYALPKGERVWVGREIARHFESPKKANNDPPKKTKSKEPWKVKWQEGKAYKSWQAAIKKDPTAAERKTYEELRIVAFRDRDELRTKAKEIATSSPNTSARSADSAEKAHPKPAKTLTK